MSALKWIEEEARYEKYELPAGASCYESDMDVVVDCAQCGRKVLYGQAYTSMQIHTKGGFGYAVCPLCYGQEMKERFHHEAR